MSNFDRAMMAGSLALMVAAIVVFVFMTWTRHVAPARERRRMLAAERIERDKDDEWVRSLNEGDILIYRFGGEYPVRRDSVGLFIGDATAIHYIHGIWRRGSHWKLKERGGPW